MDLHKSNVSRKDRPALVRARTPWEARSEFTPLRLRIIPAQRHLIFFRRIPLHGAQWRQGGATIYIGNLPRLSIAGEAYSCGDAPNTVSVGLLLKGCIRFIVYWRRITREHIDYSTPQPRRGDSMNYRTKKLLSLHLKHSDTRHWTIAR